MTEVSDHAVLRYLERVYGLDVEHYRAEMTTPGVQVVCDAFGGTGVVINGLNGTRLVLREGIIVTTLPKREDRPCRGR
ncbi:MAG: hypothetical protein GC201_01070 [Alphaproteobacteria bacterium]|nr:hypothetical protein [Alphaproteobacteria bacterium]